MTTNAIPADPFALSDSTLEELGAWARGVRISISDVPQLAGAPEAAASCLIQFLALNGRRPVDSATVTEPERALATWVKEQLRYGDTTVTDLLKPYPPRPGRPKRATIPEQLTALVTEAHTEEPAQQEPTLEQLRDFIAVHGRRPSATATDATAQERALAQWVLDQRHDRTLGAEILTVLRGVPRQTPPGFVPATRKRSRKAPAKTATPAPAQRHSSSGPLGPRVGKARRTPEQRLEELAAFCRKNGHPPSPVSPDKTEVSLAQWVYAFRATGEPARAQVQDAIAGRPHRSKLPGMDRRSVVRHQRPRATAEERLKELEQFLLDHGHRPRRRSEDKAERSLAEWASHHQRLPEPIPALAELIDEATAAERRAARLDAPGKQAVSVRPATSIQRENALKLEQLKHFCATHGRQPSQSRSGSHLERKLQQWAYGQRTYRSRMRPAVEEVLNQYPTYRQLREQQFAARRAAREAAAVPWPTNPQVMRRLEQLRAFIDGHGRVPARTNAPEAERHLADWAYRHTRLKHTHPEVMALLSTGGGYGSMGPVRSTEERREELSAFIASHSRLPQEESKDRAESSLGHWLSQHRYRKNPDPTVMAMVTRAGGYRMPARTTTRRSGELALFCALHGRQPTEVVQEEESLARWMLASKERLHPGSVAGMVRAAYPTYKDVSRGAADPVGLSANTPSRLRRMQELAQFRTTHTRMPCTQAGDQAERSLASWVGATVNGATASPAALALIHGSVCVGTTYEHRGRRLPPGVDLTGQRDA